MDRIPLLKSKLVVPEIPEKVLFTNRLRSMDIIGHKLVIITAPAGFGKTTAVLLSLKKQRNNIRWYRMEREDSFLPVFYAHLLEMLFGQETEITFDSVSSFRSIGKLSEEYPLLNALVCQDAWSLYQGGGEPLFVVFDDFHNTGGNEAIAETIGYFALNMPPNIHLIVISRVNTGIHTGKLSLSGDIAYINEQDLRFTKEEVGELASGVFKLSSGSSDTELLHNYSEGWIAGVTIIIHAAGTARVGMKELLIQGEDNRQSIFRYFLSEALAGSDRGMVKNLVRISILPDFTCEDLQGVFNIDNAAETILWLEKSSMYIQRLNAKTTRYRFHSLFRNALQSMLDELFSPDEISEMNKNAAYHYKRNGDYSLAIRFLLAAGNIAEAVRIASDEGMRLMNAGDLDNVAPLVQEFTDDTVNSDPYLLLFRGTALMNNDFEESYIFLFRALLSFRKNKNTDLQMNVVGLIISMCYKRNDLKYLKSIVPVIPKMKAFLLSRYGRKTLLLCLFMSASWSDRLGLAEFLYSLVDRLNISEPLWEYLLKITKMGLLFREGKIDAAAELQKLVASHPTTLTSDRWRLAVLALSHNIISTKGDNDASQKIVSELALIGEKYNSDYARDHAMRFDAYNKYQTRDIATAITLMESSIEAFTRIANPIMVCVLKCTKYLWEAEDKPVGPLAQAAYAEVVSLPVLMPGQGFLELCQAITGALFKEDGDYVRSEKLLRKSYAVSRRKGAALNMCGAAMHLADLYYRKKAYASEYKYLKIWACTAAAGGYAYFREMNYPTLVRVSARCIEKNICADHVKNIVGMYFEAENAARIVGDPSQIAADPKAFIASCVKTSRKTKKIKVKLFGSFKMSVDGIETGESEWKTRKICGILKYLLANPDKTVSREVLSSLFWPEAEPKNASTSLRAALYELKKVLARLGLAFEGENALLTEGKYGFFLQDRSMLEIDTALFSLLYKKYKSGSLLPDEMKVMLENITGLYEGDFLEQDLYDEWVSLAREHYRSIFIEASHNLSKIYITEGETEHAEVLLVRHMKIDPFDEKACSMLIHLYDISGRKDQSASLRRQFVKRFTAEMGVKPELKFA